MPPKAKFTREEMLSAALGIVKKKNLEGLTARALGNALGSSSCPVFTLFENMDDVQNAVLKRVREIYNGYIERGLSQNPAFKGVGTQYIAFAIDEPKLFQILFMSEREEIPDISSVLPEIDENYEKILSSITSGYSVSEDTAKKLYRHLWIYAHGIATLCATKMCSFTDGEISEMMTEVFSGLLVRLKKEQAADD